MWTCVVKQRHKCLHIIGQRLIGYRSNHKNLGICTRRAGDRQLTKRIVIKRLVRGSRSSLRADSQQKVQKLGRSGYEPQLLERIAPSPTAALPICSRAASKSQWISFFSFFPPPFWKESRKIGKERTSRKPRARIFEERLQGAKRRSLEKVGREGYLVEWEGVWANGGNLYLVSSASKFKTQWLSGLCTQMNQAGH